MGIQVTCPQGHTFKVKDKYAGKRGLCPHCTEQTIVEVPSLSTVDRMDKAYRDAVTKEHRAANPVDTGSSSIFDDIPDHNDASASGSLLGSSVIQHHVKCPFCKTSVPMWYAKCPQCGHFMEQR
jgi:hypothetical protein